MDDTTQSHNSGNMSRPMAAPVLRQPLPPVEPTQVQQPSPQPPVQEEQEDEQQPVTVSAGHPEQGPIAVIESDDEDEDEKQVSPQEVKVQASHQAEVVLPKEVKEAGVEQSDAKQLELEKQMQEASVILGNEVTPPATPKTPALPISYEEGLEAQKTNPVAKNPDNSLAWRITEILREWKKALQITK